MKEQQGSHSFKCVLGGKPEGTRWKASEKREIRGLTVLMLLYLILFVWSKTNQTDLTNLNYAPPEILEIEHHGENNGQI